MTINQVVSTPNGPGRVVSTYYLGYEGSEDPPDGILIKHAKGQEIDESLCVKVAQRGDITGWLCAYRKEQVTPTR